MDFKRQTEVLAEKGDWQEVVDACRSTVNKPPLGKEPSKKFKKEILIAEHSPIRSISFRWRWVDIYSWVATHWSRHKWECYISTQRTDKTGKKRDKLPQDAPVTFIGEANVQHLIDSWRKRLCRQASKETREYAEDFKEAIADMEPEISDVLVPNCIYRGGCPESYPCGFWEQFKKENQDIDMSNIQQRYDRYNQAFWLHGGGR